jgi:type I restriction enzyme S subunit
VRKNGMRLLDLCDIKYGYAFDSKRFTDNPIYPPLVRIRDVKRGFSETFYAGEYSKEYLLHKGDLLIGMDGEFNIARWKSVDALLNQRVCKISAKKGTNEEYIRFALSKKLKNIEDKTSFVTVKHLSARELSTIEFTMPEYEKQRKIADILVSIENIIEKKKQELEQLDTFVKSRFVELFGDPIKNPKGWEVVKLSECLERIDNGKSFTCDSNAREGVFPAILKLSAATYGDYRPYENKALLDEKQFVESVEVHRGDLLFTRKNTPDLVGMAAYVFETPEKLMMPDLIFRLVTNERMTPTFLWQLINNREFRPAIQGISGGSAKSMSNISKERLKNIEVICPPISEQKKLEGVLEQVDKSKSKIQKSLEETQLLFDSLMQKYFG